LATTIDELKAFIKEEKDVSSDVSHLSDKQFKRIKSDTEALAQLVSVLATGVQQSKARLDRLKMETGQELVNAEIAVRTRDTPTSMQYENTAPTEYFQRLISQFEGQMQSYRKQIDQTEQHLQVLGSGTSVTSEDIVAAVQKLHAAFTDLAAKYQGLHQALAVQKTSYRQLHRSLHGTAPVFETKEALKKPAQAAPLPSLSGPSPFSAPTDPLVQARNSLLSRSQAGPPTLALGTAAPTATFGSLGAAAGSFGAPASGSAFGAGNTTFGAAGGFVNPANTSFGAGGNSTTGGFGASTSFGGGFGASSSFGAASPIAGSKRNKH
jgi:nucleoporin p58/p45